MYLYCYCSLVPASSSNSTPGPTSTGTGSTSAASASADSTSASTSASGPTSGSGPTSASAYPGSAASADSTSEPEFSTCSTLQHDDDLSARTAKCAADQHVAASKHTARHRCGHLYAGPTNPVGVKTQTCSHDKKVTKLHSFPFLMTALLFWS